MEVMISIGLAVLVLVVFFSALSLVSGQISQLVETEYDEEEEQKNKE